MIKPELKGKPYLQDMSNLTDFRPSDIENFSVLVELGIGEAGNDGFDIYTVNVCTPKWLENNLKANGNLYL